MNGPTVGHLPVAGLEGADGLVSQHSDAGRAQRLIRERGNWLAWSPERQRARKHRAGARESSKSREPTSAMAVNESGLGSSADGKGEEGIDRSFDRTGIPVHLGE